MFQREKLLEMVTQWRARVEGGMEGLPRTGPDWSSEMGRWLAGVRMDGVKIAAPTGMCVRVYINYHIVSTWYGSHTCVH